MTQSNRDCRVSASKTRVVYSVLIDDVVFDRRIRGMKRVIIAITVCVMTIMINCNMCAFEARDSVSKAPSTSDKKYTTDNLYYKPYHPNDCATYAYGRAWEILGYMKENDVLIHCNLRVAAQLRIAAV